jgi:hypothetical protein
MITECESKDVRSKRPKMFVAVRTCGFGQEKLSRAKKLE